jgi:hypothetical protein
VINSTNPIKVSCTAALHHGTERRGSAFLLLSFVLPKSQFPSSPKVEGSPPKIDKRRCDVPTKLEKRGGTVEQISAVHKRTKLTDPHGGDAWHPQQIGSNYGSTEETRNASKIFRSRNLGLQICSGFWPSLHWLSTPLYSRAAGHPASTFLSLVPIIPRATGPCPSDSNVSMHQVTTYNFEPMY